MAGNKAAIIQPYTFGLIVTGEDFSDENETTGKQPINEFR